MAKVAKGRTAIREGAYKAVQSGTKRSTAKFSGGHIVSNLNVTAAKEQPRSGHTRVANASRSCTAAATTAG